MIRRLLRLGLRAGLLASIVLGLVKILRGRSESSSPKMDESWLAQNGSTPAEPPSPPEPRLVEPTMLTSVIQAPLSRPGPGPVAIKVPTVAWVEPEGTSCPASHPVKGKLSSGIYHLPGMAAYDRTRPDRCYAGPEGAEADGLTRAKR